MCLLAFTWTCVFLCMYRACVYVSIHVCIFECMCVWVRVSARAHVHERILNVVSVCTFVWKCARESICLCVSAFMFGNTYVCVDSRVHECVGVYVFLCLQHMYARYDVCACIYSCSVSNIGAHVCVNLCSWVCTPLREHVFTYACAHVYKATCHTCGHAVTYGCILYLWNFPKKRINVANQGC